MHKLMLEAQEVKSTRVLQAILTLPYTWYNVLET